MDYFGWSGLALTHGTRGGTDGQHWTENKEIMEELNLKHQLSAANKAIVALVEALESHKLDFYGCTNDDVVEALTLYAPAIEKARGG